MNRLLLVIALTIMPTLALAQQGENVPLPKSNPFKLGPLANLANSPLIKYFQSWTANDIKAAQDLAMSIPDLQDPIGAACWKTFANMGAIIQQHPLPATLNIATDIQALRLFNMAVKKVCMQPECSQLWNDLNNQIAAFAPIPAPLSLASACAKIL